MPEDLNYTVKESSKRFGWHLLGDTVGVLRDYIYIGGDLLTKSGDWVNRFADIFGGFGKEMYKLGLKMRERVDHQNEDVGNETEISTAEKVWMWLTVPFIGWAWRRNRNNYDGLDVDSEQYTIYIPGLFTGILRLVEWAAKIPGTAVWLLGEGVKMLARGLGAGRDKINNFAPQTADEEQLRTAEHKYIQVLHDVYHSDDLKKAQRSHYRRIYTLIGASTLHQLGLLLSLPGRLVHAVGLVFDNLSLIANNILMGLSRWGERTLLDYATNLHASSGGHRGPAKLATLALAGFTGLLGAIITYVPKAASFVVNYTYGLLGFGLENLGKVLAWPGMLVKGVAQRLSADPKLQKTTLDFDFNDHDYSYGGRDAENSSPVDPDQAISIRGKLKEIFIRRTSSQKRAYDGGLRELRERYKLYKAKAGEAKAAEAATLALEGAYGYMATELQGFRNGFGEGHGQYPDHGDYEEENNDPNAGPVRQNDGLFVAIKKAAGDDGMKFRKPDMTHGIFGYYSERSAAARWLRRKIHALDGDERQALEMPDLGEGGEVVRMDNFDEHSGLLASARRTITW